MILVDSNVLIDVIDEDGVWVDWSLKALATARTEDSLAVNAVVRAEIASRFSTLAEQDVFLTELKVATLPLNDAAAFRAGQAFRSYRKNSSSREAILADFLIGAHASSLAARLLTRDRKRFASYFPELTLITPETEHG